MKSYNVWEARPVAESLEEHSDAKSDKEENQRHEEDVWSVVKMTVPTAVEQSLTVVLGGVQVGVTVDDRGEGSGGHVGQSVSHIPCDVAVTCRVVVLQIIANVI